MSSEFPFRLRPRFTLAALLVLIAVVAIPLSYVAQRRAWNLKRKAAYEQFQQMHYVFDETWPATNLAPRPSADPFAAPVTSEVPKWTLQGWWNDMCLESATPQISSIEIGVDPFGGNESFEPKDVFVHLALFPELSELWIQDGKGLDDRCLASLKSLSDLRLLHLWRAPDVRGDFLEHLRSSKLETLSLQDLSALNHLPNLAGFAKLTKLELELCDNLNDESLRAVEAPSGLKTLRVSSSRIGDATLSRWLKSTKLEDLSLEASVTRAIAPALAHQTKLQHLRVYDAPLRDEDLTFLSECRSLNTLSLEVMPIRGDFFGWLKFPESLHSMSVSTTLLSDKNVGAIRRCRNLRQLELDWTPISGEGFEGEADWPPLQELTLQGTQFSDRGKTAFAKVTGPQMVELPFNWTVDDFRRYPEGAAPYGYAMVISGTLTGSKRWQQCRDSPLWRSEANNVSKEELTPVLRLYESAQVKMQKDLEEQFHREANEQ